MDATERETEGKRERRCSKQTHRWTETRLKKSRSHKVTLNGQPG
jgi:hypothetical protein